jgi:predicted acylesterase/phospholipase RssA
MSHQDSHAVDRAKAYLRGAALTQEEIYGTDKKAGLWKQLKKELEFGFAHRVLAHFEDEDRFALSNDQRAKVCQQHALCLSKDPDTSAAVRHDEALTILRKRFDLPPDLAAENTTEDQETLGIAGGIWKRKYRAFGQIEDLKRSLRCYELGYAGGPANDYGYTAINAAFVNDFLAHLGDRPAERRQTAREIRKHIVREVSDLPKDASKGWLNDEWWYLATLAEARFGLGEFPEAQELLEKAVALAGTAYWEYETTATQLVDLAWLQHGQAAVTESGIRDALEVLTGPEASVDSVLVGKVGLALSGGGFRASLYHLGVLARLAELDVLRHVDVLSCVSGGSIVGAAYYLFLRRRIAQSGTSLASADYVTLTKELIAHFEACVSTNVREHVQEGWLGLVRNLWDRQGGLDSNRMAERLDQIFYAPVAELEKPWMHAINAQPGDHDPAWRQQGAFNPKRHNWSRAHKVPQLVLNATTMNTGHAWQFTTTWMGESPYAIHEEVDSVPRLRRPWYKPSPPNEGAREVTVGQAVAASAAVPGAFGPLRLSRLYRVDGEDVDVFLVDGGVYDNQGTVSLLAQDCNVLLVSDAAGQLAASYEEPRGFKGRLGFAARSLSVLMERTRQAVYADLKARVRSGQLRGLMFLHMKDDLQAEPIEWVGCQESYQPNRWSALTRTEVRRDIQDRLAKLRTDLDEFSEEEARFLMAAGYQMSGWSFKDSLGQIPGLSSKPITTEWAFQSELEQLRDTSERNRAPLLARLDAGSQVSFDPDATAALVDEASAAAETGPPGIGARIRSFLGRS